MELGVWVEGSLRVVCGLSRGTSVQEVVIALAQDLGQTGRYVLTLRLHGSERQLLKDECPLQELSVLRENSRDAQFFLHRTGPSAGAPHPQLPPSREKRPPPRTRTPDPLPSKSSREHFDEPSSLYGTFPRRGRSKKPRVAVPQVDKEAVYLQLLQQTRRIQELGERIAGLEGETMGAEPTPGSRPGPEPDLREQLEVLEERQRQNDEELEREVYWMGQLEEEERRAEELNHRLEQLQWSVHYQTQRLDSLLSRSHSLQGSVREQSEEALKPLQQELQKRHLQGERISTELERMQGLVRDMDHTMRSQTEQVEELNKDLRQCNLQQFILQASGSAPSDQPVQSVTVPSDLTNLMPLPEIYLSSAGILE